MAFNRGMHGLITDFADGGDLWIRKNNEKHHEKK